MSNYTYIQAMGLGFPGIPCSATGDGSDYASLVAADGYELPSKEALDTWIAANQQSATRHITRMAFRNRYTSYEKTIIEVASCDDPNATTAERMNSAFIRAALKDVDCAAYVDLDRDDTRAGVQAMEALGLIAAGRAAEILDAPIKDVERPLDEVYV